MSTVLVSPEQLQGNAIVNFRLASESPTILVASGDPAIQDSLAELLEPYSINTVWVKGLADAKIWFGTQKIAACLCGFQLDDGTCRDFVKQAKRETAEIPVIIVSTPACAHEYREYLAAMNTGAFDFLCYPYRRRELEGTLRGALTNRIRAAR